MKIIIAGSRTVDPEKWVEDIKFFISEDFELVTGCARGADQIAYMITKNPTEFPADWDRFGKRAGYIRNYNMAQYADVLIAVWDGHSKGTRNMIDIMLDMGKEVHVFIDSDPPNL